MSRRPRATNRFFRDLNGMPSQEQRTLKPATAKASDECVLLIGDEAGETAKILEGSRSATDEGVRVECASELSSGIERLRSGGVAAVVLDLTFPDSGGMEAFDR